MKPSRIIKSILTTCLFALSMLALNVKAQNWTEVWNPPGGPSGEWSAAANWTSGAVPTDETNAIFNVSNAPVCIIDSSAGGAVCWRMNVGEDNTGSANTVIVTNGGTFDAVGDYCALGYSDQGTFDVESGCSATFGVHLWVGMFPGTTGTLILNGGTVTIVGQIGLGWQGGTGFVHVNSGTLNLDNWIPNPGNTSTENVSINNLSTMDISGGTVMINGDHSATGDGSVPSYVSGGRITAYGGTGSVNVSFNGTQTVITGTPSGSSTSTITGIMQSGGQITITYSTSPLYTYHLVSSPTLSAPSITWPTVTGSPTNVPASQYSVTYTFPNPGSGKMFYRVSSP